MTITCISISGLGRIILRTPTDDETIIRALNIAIVEYEEVYHLTGDTMHLEVEPWAIDQRGALRRAADILAGEYMP